MPACDLPPANRRAQVRKVGNDLLTHYGRKPYYSVSEVKAANLRQEIAAEFTCWSHAAFNSHEDFTAYHESIGEICDYVAMKAEMLSSVSSATATSWFDLDLSWLEFPDIDWSLFDVLDL